MGNPRCADADRLPCYLLLDIHEMVAKTEKAFDEIRADLMNMGVHLAYLSDSFGCQENVDAMPEPTRQEMMLEKSRQTLMDLNADESVKQVARDVMLCDLHRWMEEWKAACEKNLTEGETL